jgi:hypothetical protein
MNIHIRPDPIVDAGNAMTEVADVVSSAVDMDFAPSRAAADGHPGWEAAAALTQATQAWEEQMGALTSQLGQLGDRLRGSANDYARTDAEAARRINEVFVLLSST